MKDNLIFGINPLTISKVLWSKGYRRGYHPLMSKYLSRKHPIKGFFGFYQSGLFDYYAIPEVLVYGSNGNLVLRIPCKSNDQARDTHDYINNTLNEFLSSIRIQNDNIH